MKLSRMTLPALAAFALAACAAGEQQLIEDGARKLTGDEITAAFSDIREDYVGRDSNIIGAAEWGKDGSFEIVSDLSNTPYTEITGKWYVESDQRCIAFDQDLRVNPECVSIYETGDFYTSVWDDGRLHGEHRLTPLGQ